MALFRYIDIGEVIQMSDPTSQKPNNVIHIVPKKIHQLDVVVPFYNPQAHWEEPFIEYALDLQNALPECQINFILIDDGSKRNFTDHSEESLKSQLASVRVIRYRPNRGKGNAVRIGMAHAKSPYMIYTDADFPYDVESAVRVFRSLLNGTDLACGLRHELYYKKIPLQRRLISGMFQWVNSHFLRLPVRDTQCGLKGLTEKAKVSLMMTKIDHYLFDVEFMVIASRQTDLRIGTCDVVLRPNIVVPKMTIKVLAREVFNLARVMARIIQFEFRNWRT